MHAHGDQERGDTLIEILIAIVLIGLMMSVLFASLTMSSTGSNKQKHLATADGLLRNYAEAAKTAVRTSCLAGATFTVTPPATPAGFSLSSTPDLSTPQTCPSKAAAPGVSVLQLSVSVPDLTDTKGLDVTVRSP